MAMPVIMSASPLHRKAAAKEAGGISNIVRCGEATDKDCLDNSLAIFWCIFAHQSLIQEKLIQENLNQESHNQQDQHTKVNCFNQHQYDG